MTRHQRRKLAEARKASKDALFISRFIHEQQKAKLRANLSQPFRGKRSPKGVVSSIYSGTANALGFTRPMKYSKGVAK